MSMDTDIERAAKAVATALEAVSDTERPMTRERILAFERELAKIPQFDFPVKHYFSKGVYAREIFIPAGFCLTGKIHRFENLNIVSKGRLVVVTEQGRQIVSAPFTIVSPPGTKRIGFALEDTVWTTIHPNPTEELDLVALEEMFIVKSFEALEAPDKTLILEGN